MTPCPIEDRIAIAELLIAYAHAVDSMHDLDGICDVFLPGAVFDLSGIGMQAFHGHDGIRSFYTQVFGAMAHQAHYLSNIAITAYAGDTASARAYVTGMALGKDGNAVRVHGRYYVDVVRTSVGWKVQTLSMDFLLPVGGAPDDANT